MNARARFAAMVLPMLGLLALPSGAAAQVAADNKSELGALSFVDESLTARPVVEAVDDIQGSLRSSVASSWAEWRNLDGEWTASVDKRTGHLDLVEGSGIPWIPGSGNRLTSLATAEPGISTLERISRSFLPRVAPMLGVDVKSLKLDPDRSGSPSDYLWYVDYNVELDGLPVDGARVVFRVNHGNLIQFGTENLPSPGVKAPAAKLTRNQALSVLAGYIGGFRAADSFVDNGSQHLLPAAIADSRFNDGFALGQGRGLVRVWQFVFRRDGDGATWRARVDAAGGKVLELRDINAYAAAQITGGAKFLGVPATRPMPFADVSAGGYTNSAGVYNYTSGVVTSALNGQYVKITDNCGAISQSSGAGGNISFGTSAGTDCTTPGSGGAGNTHSARTQFYHVNRAKEMARGWLTRTWLTGQLTANVNINDTCNAFFNGTSLNFYRSGGGCGNTGEIEGVSLHEYGHALDSNDGNNFSADFGTAETYGDFTAVLANHTSCVGSGFFPVGNCSGYGDFCTSCSGNRDIDWAKHNSNTAHTVANFTQIRCPSDPGYSGPCGLEGHCESYVSSEALYDLAARDLPNPGSGAAWTTVERLWYLSRATATAAFTCIPTGTFTSNGCGAGSNWKTMRAVDDDDGNLANGTPHSAALYAAFNRHGIACTTDAGANTSFRGCTPPAVPTLSLTGGDNQVTVTVSGSAGLYDVYRTENGCNSGFIKISNDAVGPSIIDTGVANGFAYSYQVTAQPNGNEACATAPSTCLQVTPAFAPCTPPAAPAALSATPAGPTQVNLLWTASPGATGYNVYRAAASGGPYTFAGFTAANTFSNNTGLTCGTPYYYVVRAANSSTCESGSSIQATATTGVCPSCTTTLLYTNSFDTATGLSDWTKESFGGSTTSWRGVQACTAQSGANIFRYGGTACTGNYYNYNDFNFAVPKGATGIAVPAGSTTSRLSFWHRRDFEDGYDGGTLALSVDGLHYEYVPASAILSGTTYNGTIDPTCPPSPAVIGAAVFTGNDASFTNTTVDLDAACNVASGTTGGCAGRPLYIAFTSITDCDAIREGWFLDDVSVTACVPPSPPLDFYTMAPCRLVDTRDPTGPNGGPALLPGQSRTFLLAGSCGIPAAARALSVNITAVSPTTGGNLSLFPADVAPPTSSSINFQAGQNRANNALITLSAGGEIKVKSNTAAPIHFALDVNGWYQE
jgi:trimeric autotransporter adhesin